MDSVLSTSPRHFEPLTQGRHFFAQFLRVPPYHPVSYSSTKGPKVTKGPLKDLKTASNQKGVPGFGKEDFSYTT